MHLRWRVIRVLCFGAFFISRPILVFAQEECPKKIVNLATDQDRDGHFQRRAWFASEDPLEQAQVLDYLMKYGKLKSGPLHDFETRRWQEFNRDIFRILRGIESDWSHIDRTELEEIVSDVVTDSILESWMDVKAATTLDAKISWVLARVKLALTLHDQDLEVQRTAERESALANDGRNLRKDVERAIDQIITWGIQNLPLTEIEMIVIQDFIHNNRDPEKIAEMTKLESGVVRGILESFLQRLKTLAPLDLIETAHDVYRKANSERRSARLRGRSGLRESGVWDLIVRLNENEGRRDD